MNLKNLTLKKLMDTKVCIVVEDMVVNVRAARLGVTMDKRINPKTKFLITI